MPKTIAALLLLASTVLVHVHATQVEEPDGAESTKCQTGAADILGSRKAVTAQVCNLFGDTCYINHPGLTADQCGTMALKIEPGQCALYPIFTYESNVRTGDSAVEDLSTISDFGCSVSVSSSNGVYTTKFGAACASIQCSLGEGNGFAGPGFSSTTSNRVQITDAASHEFTAQNFASISDGADQAKNVFLVRTGNYVGTTRAQSSTSNSKGYYYGELPTSNGNNYGPVACPSSGNALTSATATGITAEDLRMCGNTGKWAYYNGYNFLEDKPAYIQYGGNTLATGTGTAANINIGAADFLEGKSAYRSGTAMDDSRKVYLLDGDTSSSDVLMTSDTITPQPGTSTAFKDEVGGTWRNFGVAFYCDDYARNDLTTCAEANRKMFYTCDPNPNACYGTATQISSNNGAMGDTCTVDGDCCSGTCTDSACAAGCETAGDYGGGDTASAPTPAPDGSAAGGVGGATDVNSASSAGLSSVLCVFSLVLLIAGQQLM
jgi:hypothetical protein